MGCTAQYSKHHTRCRSNLIGALFQVARVRSDNNYQVPATVVEIVPPLGVLRSLPDNEFVFVHVTARKGGWYTPVRGVYWRAVGQSNGIA